MFLVSIITEQKNKQKDCDEPTSSCTWESISIHTIKTQGADGIGFFILKGFIKLHTPREVSQVTSGGGRERRTR